MIALARYLLVVATDGDYLNDWITHLPEGSIDTVQTVGWLLAVALGY
jgi:hypothetical protein